MLLDAVANVTESIARNRFASGGRRRSLRFATRARSTIRMALRLAHRSDV